MPLPTYSPGGMGSEAHEKLLAVIGQHVLGPPRAQILSMFAGAGGFLSWPLVSKDLVVRGARGQEGDDQYLRNHGTLGLDGLFLRLFLPHKYRPSIYRLGSCHRSGARCPRVHHDPVWMICLGTGLTWRPHQRVYRRMCLHPVGEITPQARQGDPMLQSRGSRVKKALNEDTPQAIKDHQT